VNDQADVAPGLSWKQADMVSVPFHEMDVLLRVVNDVARQGHAEGLDNGDVPAQKRPFSPRYDGIPRTDPRCRDSRETALSIRILFERAAAGGNGAGKLVIDFLLEEQSWYSFTETERYHMEKLIRKFRRELVRTGFIDEAGSLPDEKRWYPEVEAG